MMNQTTQRAVIYCRSACIASAQKEGDSIDPQLTRCREFAKHEGYEICAVFKDEGVGGNVTQRPGIQSMLKYLKSHRRNNMTVIIDDPARLARGMEALISLRTKIANMGAKLASPGISFDEKQSAILAEHLLTVSRGS
ncbi:hypothetical protein ABF87_09175 [Nitrosomonas sp. JL21]|uniref:recombinase family protein n=1 Tax=Nitrosomonas sp. JL21 TaxID=153949 RepID=UPI0013720F61|nr:recombinase family protein [Nitrosomonas sp. JL21]MBL8496801.1 recombinase family protein [Nitrosomonas sp.]MBL8498447.1 recombinase family protein [Nitrosomonas sp.]MXS78125.1 hypothetical protein [Nitrosomonas sp. JL21]